MQMQETLLNAYKEAQTTSSSLPSNVTNMESQQQLLQPQLQSLITTHDTTNSNNSKVMTKFEGKNFDVDIIHNLPIKVENHSDNAGLSELFSHFTSADNNKDNYDDSETDNAANRISVSQAQQNWLAETMSIIPTLDPSQYINDHGFSPTYTSKSFDDLHQFIGQDFSHVENTNKSSKNSSNNLFTEEIKGPATDAANSMQSQVMKINSFADAYSLFAQQSATAVSTHSAYACGTQEQRREMNRSNVDTLVSNEMHLLSGSESHLNKNFGSGQNSIGEKQETSTVSVKNNGDDSTNSSHKNKRESASSAVFSAANLQLHSAAVAEMERSDTSSKDDVESESVSKSSINSSNVVAPTTRDKPNSKFDASVLRHSNVVSGSDRSSSDNGSASIGGSGLSGSDNASDNSDSASDEGRGSGNSDKGRKRRNESTEIEQVGAKRKHSCKMVSLKTSQQ